MTMVSPGDIEQAERFGMPEYEPESETCPQCGSDQLSENIQKCEMCGKRCCPMCWVWIPDYAAWLCTQECHIKYLEKMIAELERDYDGNR
jgi:hypothetical protein